MNCAPYARLYLHIFQVTDSGSFRQPAVPSASKGVVQSTFESLRQLYAITPIFWGFPATFLKMITEGPSAASLMLAGGWLSERMYTHVTFCLV